MVQKAGDKRGEMLVRGNLSALFARQNRFDAALRAAETASKLARQVADLKALAKLEHNRGQILLNKKQVSLATDAFSASLGLSTELDWREGIAMNAAQLRSLEERRSASFLKPR